MVLNPTVKEMNHKITMKTASKHPMLFVLDLVVKRKLLFIYVIFGIITHQSLRFVQAPIVGDLVEFGIQTRSYDKIYYYTFLLLLTALISAFFDLTMSWANEIIANHVEYHTRSIFFKNVQEKSQSFHDESKIGQMLAIIQNDMRSLYSAMAPGIRIMGESFISLITITIIIFLESFWLGLLYTLLIPVWLLALKIYAKRLTPVSIRQQNDFRELSAEVQENLGAAEVIRAFSQEFKELNKFRTLNNQYAKTWEDRGRVTALYFPMLATYFTAGLIFLAGIYLSTHQTFTFLGIEISQQFGVGGMVTLIILIIQLRGPTMQINFVLEFWALGLAGVEKIQEIIAIDDQLPVVENPIVKEINGDVEYKDVSFTYKNGSTILSNITFSASKGDIVAIVGATGSGKTTLLKLLTRLYDVTDGKILVDGIDVREYDPDVLSSSIGVVEQDIFLFSTSIRENITYAGDSFSENEINQVVKQARINEFLDQLPAGLDTVVGERGVRLSGGQKQRVAIARAFLINPKILILDDASSAIDGKTENEIVSALKELMSGRTTFLITNRLNMIRQATKVLVLEYGKISGEGTHEELIQTNKVYRRIFDPHMELGELKEEN